MSRPRDSQRSRCYNAEAVARHVVSGRRFESLAEVQAYVDDVVGSAWWEQNSPRQGSIVVSGSRGRKATASMLHRFKPGHLRIQDTITMPAAQWAPWAWQDWVVLHELAHVGRFTEGSFLHQTEAGHSPEWAGFYLALVGEFMGADARDALGAEFEKHRVRYLEMEHVG